MIQQFLRARAHHFMRGILGEREFKARSVERDGETDRGRIQAVAVALDEALRSAEVEQAGLTRRMDDVLSRAAVTFGNGDDEYLTRDKLDSDHLDLFEREIANGQAPAARARRQYPALQVPEVRPAEPVPGFQT